MGNSKLTWFLYYLIGSTPKLVSLLHEKPHLNVLRCTRKSTTGFRAYCDNQTILLQHPTNQTHGFIKVLGY